MRVFIFITLLFPGFALAQPRVKKLDKPAIPKTADYKGNLKNAVSWSDSTGSHLVLTTETGITDSKGGTGNRDAALYAYHYMNTRDSLTLTWKLNDYIRDCPVDIQANYIRNSFAVTDLDKNGRAEVWLMYKTVCHGDVSPSDMKIIMYQDDRKYAVRGTTRVPAGENSFMGGEFAFDDAFKKGPEVFRSYAAQLWKKNIKETFD